MNYFNNPVPIGILYLIKTFYRFYKVKKMFFFSGVEHLPQMWRYII